ncbi:type IIL restriction-modification enzyme MmeI [Deinococcus radiopugnans]
MTESQAAGYLAPFEYVREKIKPERDKNNDRRRRTYWWQLGRAGTELKQATSALPRFIGIPRVAKHLLPVWLPAGTLPDSQVVSIARDDDFTFGVLASSIHRVWARAQGTYMGVGNDLRYTPSTTFETFPFPETTAEQRSDIEKWARYVVQVRGHLLTQDPKATLTGLYNEVGHLQETPDAANPVAALVTAHARLDSAVTAAYGWEWPLAEDELLARLLALNLERAASR